MRIFMRFTFTYAFLALALTSFGQGPPWQWAKQAGGNQTDIVNALSTDSNGNVYIAGYFYSDSISFGDTTLLNELGDNLLYDSNVKMFLAKYDSTGNLLWAKLGPPVTIYQMTIDKTDNIIFTGYFTAKSISFDDIHIVNNDTLTAFTSNYFIAKYSQNGEALWAQTASGNNFDTGTGVVGDIDGNIYVLGEFQSDLLVFNSSITLVNTSDFRNSDFIAKYSSNGILIWARVLDTRRYSVSYDPTENSRHTIALDPSGNLFVAGQFWKDTLSIDQINLVRNGYFANIFLIKFDPDSNVLWARQVGIGYCSGISSSQEGDIYMIGLHVGEKTTFDEIEWNNDTTSGFFIMKLNKQGSVTWAKPLIKRLEGAGTTGHLNIATNKGDNIIVSGTRIGGANSFDDVSVIQTNSQATTNIFIVQYSHEGNAMWATGIDRFGIGGYIMTSNGLALDPKGNIYITGNFSNPSIIFDTTVLNNAWVLQNPGIASNDIFLAKIDACNLGAPRILADGPTTFCCGENVTLSSSSALGVLWNSGETSQSIDVNSSGIYSISLSNDQCTLHSKEITIVVHPLPTAAISANGPTSLCEGDLVTLTSVAAMKYIWSNGSSSQSISTGTKGSFWVAIEDANGCSNLSDTISVYVNPLPEPEVISDGPLTFCKGGQVVLTTNQSQNYLWSTNETTPGITVKQAGEYSVVITNEFGCSATSNPLIVETVIPLPKIRLQADCKRIFTESESVADLQLFRNGETLGPASSIKEYVPTDSGRFYVESFNLCGTVRSNMVFFKPADLKYIFMPNIITPNGDSNNEFFILDDKIEHAALSIYNRWGNVVYHEKNYQNTWNAGELVSGVYFYSIIHPCFSNAIIGTVTVIR